MNPSGFYVDPFVCLLIQDIDIQRGLKASNGAYKIGVGQ